MKHLIWLSILLAGGCAPAQPHCVELVETGEYAVKIDQGIVRLVKTGKLIKARYVLDDYIYVEQEFCKYAKDNQELNTQVY